MEQGKTGSVLSCGVRSTRWVRLALGHAYVKASGVRCAGPCTCRVWRLRGKAHFSLKEANRLSYVSVRMSACSLSHTCRSTRRDIASRWCGERARFVK